MINKKQKYKIIGFHSRDARYSKSKRYIGMIITLNDVSTSKFDSRMIEGDTLNLDGMYLYHVACKIKAVL